MNVDKEIESLQKKIKELRELNWEEDQRARKERFELKVLNSLMKKLQAIVGDWDFKSLLFKSLHFYLEDACLGDIDERDLVHTLQDEFKLRIHEWDHYYSIQRAFYKGFDNGQGKANSNA